MKRALVLLCCLALAACTGLFFDHGNTFPCDFSAGPGVRDAVCVGGDVCGTDNLCHKFIYEGPRFEGSATVPEFSAGNFARIHPVTLDSAITQLARAPTAETGALFARLETGEQISVNRKGQLSNEGLSTDQLTQAVYFRVEFDTPGGTVEALALGGIAPVSPTTGRLAYTARTVDGTLRIDNRNGAFATAFRASPVAGRIPLLQGIDAMGAAADIVRGGVMNREFQFSTPYPIDAGVIDVGVLTRDLRAPTRIALTPFKVWTENRTGGGFTEAEVNQVSTDTLMRINGASTLLAIQRPRVLTTFQIGLGEGAGPAHVLQRAWEDCTPCGRAPTAVMLRVTPVPPSEGVAVDVMCASPTPDDLNLRLLRVTGSTAVEPVDGCIAEERELPFDAKRINRLAVDRIASAIGQRGVAVGGKHGEIWAGETLTSMQPIALERVPLDVFTATVEFDGGTFPSMGVITDRYVAMLQPAVPGKLPGGFRRLDGAGDFEGTTGFQLISAIHGVADWGLQSNGVLVKFRVNESESTPSQALFGPRLTTPIGDPIRRTAGGESFALADGGFTFFVAADDGLYFVTEPEKHLGMQSSVDLTPQLQPEPSVPIRSLALERTPVGTDGEKRAHGYLVTARNVFEWRLSGSPARWSSTPLAVAAGDPLEVWFDTKRSALGRVGYSDGRIFTLPGGNQLANALPGDAGTVVRLTDYENFGGWPVALATNGLFIARWDQAPNGKLQNRFPDGGVNRPMDWVEVTLPDGSRPWLRDSEARGRLFVSERELNVPAGTSPSREFTLFVFLDDMVIRVGVYQR